MDREDIKMLVAKWWDIYNDDSLDFNPADGGPGAEVAFSGPLQETLVPFVTVPSAA